MQKLKIKKMIIMCMAIITSMIVFTANLSYAMTISQSSSSVTLTKGQSTTVTLTATDATGNLTVSSSNPSVATASISSNWIENNSVTVTITAKETGTASITVGGRVANNNASSEVDVAKTISVNVSGTNSNTNNGGNGSNSNSGSSSNSSPGTGSTSASNQIPTATKSNNASLKNLGIKPNDFSGFSPSKTSYSVTVPNNVESIEVYAYKGQDNQTISGTGKKTLKEGENTFQVNVTAEDGKTKKTYTVVVTRKKQEDKSNQENQVADNTTSNEEQTEEKENLEENQGEVGFGLSDLQIGTLTLTPEFKTDIYEYNTKLEGSQNELDIKTVTTDANSKVEITGNKDLKDGENIITIMVTDETGEKMATYQITVQKSAVDEETIAKQKEIEEKEKQKKIIAIAIAVVLVILILVSIIISRRRKNMYAKEYTLPFANLNQDEEQNEAYSYTEETKENVKEEYLNQEIQNDFDDDMPIKKKRGKGKRYK